LEETTNLTTGDRGEPTTLGKGGTKQFRETLGKGEKKLLLYRFRKKLSSEETTKEKIKSEGREISSIKQLFISKGKQTPLKKKNK